jgi:hypothetical protein
MKRTADIANGIATAIAYIGAGCALATGHPEGATFPAAIGSITAGELYRPKNTGKPDIEGIRYGLKKSAFAKGAFAVAGSITAGIDYLMNGNMESISMLPFVTLPLVLSATGDLYQNSELKKMSH